MEQFATTVYYRYEKENLQKGVLAVARQIAEIELDRIKMTSFTDKVYIELISKYVSTPWAKHETICNDYIHLMLQKRKFTDRGLGGCLTDSGI